MRLTSLSVPLFILITFVTAPPAHAFWGDVHYDLTYYVARYTGFTPEQASRIAYAAWDVDWDEATKPDKKLANGDYDMTAAGQNPRIWFHAMRDARTTRVSFQADRDDRETQADRLLKHAIQTENLGPWMHFVQDCLAHAGYDSRQGHWVDPDRAEDSIDDPPKDGQGNPLPLGGGTDFAACHGQAAMRDLADEMAAGLSEFMGGVSPHQTFRSLPTRGTGEYDQGVGGLIDQLISDNPAPAQPDKVAFVMAYFDPDSLKDQRHFGGPSMGRAHAVTVQALASAGLWETPSEEIVVDQRSRPYMRYHFRLDANGLPEPTTKIDNWVVVGDLEVEVAPPQAGAKTTARTVVEVYLQPTRSGQQEELLAREELPPTGGRVEFVGMPIGRVRVDADRGDGATGKWVGLLTKAKQSIRIQLSGGSQTQVAGNQPGTQPQPGLQPANPPQPGAPRLLALKKLTVSGGPSDVQDKELAQAGGLTQFEASYKGGNATATVDIALRLKLPATIQWGDPFLVGAQADYQVSYRTGEGTWPISIVHVMLGMDGVSAKATVPSDDDGNSTTRGTLPVTAECSVPPSWQGGVRWASDGWAYSYTVSSPDAQVDYPNEERGLFLPDPALAPAERGEHAIYVIRLSIGDNSLNYSGERESWLFFAHYGLGDPVALPPFTGDLPPPPEGSGRTDTGRPPYAPQVAGAGGAGDRPTGADGNAPGSSNDQTSGEESTGDHPADALAPLRAEQPWNHPQVQQAIGSFLGDTKPRGTAEAYSLTWTQWGHWQGRNGETMISAQAPSTGLDRFHYIWLNRGTMQSVRHGDLEAYIRRFLSGEPTLVGEEGRGLDQIIADEGGIPEVTQDPLPEEIADADTPGFEDIHFSGDETEAGGSGTTGGDATVPPDDDAGDDEIGAPPDTQPGGGGDETGGEGGGDDEDEEERDPFIGVWKGQMSYHDSRANEDHACSVEVTIAGDAGTYRATVTWGNDLPFRLNDAQCKLDGDALRWSYKAVQPRGGPKGDVIRKLMFQAKGDELTLTLSQVWGRLPKMRTELEGKGTLTLVPAEAEDEQ